MKSMLKTIDDHGIKYQALMFVCPGCSEERVLENGKTYNPTGLHLLPVNTDKKKPSWDWDGNLEAPTISPSILTGKGTDDICHSFLKKGIFQFLEDSTHSLSGTYVPIPDLPDWVTREGEDNGRRDDSTPRRRRVSYRRQGRRGS